MSDASHAYSAFGAAIRSNRPLPNLAPRRGDERRTVVIDVAECAAEALDTPDAPVAQTRFERSARLAGGSRLIRYDAPHDGRAWTMLIRADGSRIDVAHTAGLGAENVFAIMQTAGLATAVQLGGVPVLHGCAVELGAGAIILLGPSGAGKSTTAAALLARGHPLVTDDVAAVEVLDGTPVVHPGPTRLRLTHATAHALGRDPHALPRVFDEELLSDKRALDVSAADGSFGARPRPVVAIYELASRRPAEAGPEVTRLRPDEALRALLANGYRAAFLAAGERARLLPSLARIAESVPVRRVAPADDLGRLPHLVDALVADAATI